MAAQQMNGVIEMNMALKEIDLQARKASEIAEGVLQKISQAARDAFEASRGGSVALAIGRAPGADQAAAAGRMVSAQLTARLQKFREAAAAAGGELTGPDVRSAAHQAWAEATDGLRQAPEGERSAPERQRG